MWEAGAVHVNHYCPMCVYPSQSGSAMVRQWRNGDAQLLNGLYSYLCCLHLCDFDTDEYLRRLACDMSNAPTIGMAMSGGGWMPALTDTGPLLAFGYRFGTYCAREVIPYRWQ